MCCSSIATEWILGNGIGHTLQTVSSDTLKKEFMFV